MGKKYRNLTESEIGSLTAQGCVAQDWALVRVSEKFDVGSVRNVRFGGEVFIGVCGTALTDADGVKRRSGIYNSEIINCRIGDDIFISNIGSYIANYDIEDNVIIENTGKIVCRGESRFGNGTLVRAVNEGGGREVPIYNELSAQMAYLMAFYRHRGPLNEMLGKIVGRHCGRASSSRGRIEQGARINGCGALRDVNVGQKAVIDGVSELSDGTVNSTEQYPSYVGASVTAHHFVFARGTMVSGGVYIERCFVGEACKLENNFTAIDSLFFSNSHLGCGEATSIFAGPYTVSHHKSSLLIAGYFLFFNAGSGTNQSNHLFKTGAVHQGIHERGCKFGSNAYAVLPAREGAFTAVIGRHSSHHDTAMLPYSYMFDKAGSTYIHPGANLRSYGTLRDMEKWPLRDGRGADPADRIHFDEFNPYVGEKIMGAVELCRGMLAENDVEVYNYERVWISAAVLERGLQLYELAAEAFVGYILSKGRDKEVQPSPRWIDAAGMFMPREDMDAIIEGIESGALASVEDIERAFGGSYASYADHAYAWALSKLERILGRAPSEREIADAAERGLAAAESIQRLRRNDGLKDSSRIMETGYGIDSEDRREIDDDFKAVRGL